MGCLPEHFTFDGYKWRVDMKAGAGEMGNLLQAAADELKANANGTFQYYQWEMAGGVVSLRMTARVRRGTQNLTVNMYYNFEPTLDGETMTLKYTGADNNGESYLAAMPSMNALINKLGSTALSFSTENRISALSMQLRVGDNDYMTINLQ